MLSIQSEHSIEESTNEEETSFSSLLSFFDDESTYSSDADIAPMPAELQSRQVEISYQFSTNFNYSLRVLLIAAEKMILKTL